MINWLKEMFRRKSILETARFPTKEEMDEFRKKLKSEGKTILEVARLK